MRLKRILSTSHPDFKWMSPQETVCCLSKNVRINSIITLSKSASMKRKHYLKYHAINKKNLQYCKKHFSPWKVPKQLTLTETFWPSYCHYLWGKEYSLTSQKRWLTLDHQFHPDGAMRKTKTNCLRRIYIPNCFRIKMI